MQNLILNILKLKQQWCSNDFDTSIVMIKLMHSHLLLLITVFLQKSQSCFSTFSSFKIFFSWLGFVNEDFMMGFVHIDCRYACGQQGQCEIGKYVHSGCS